MMGFYVRAFFVFVVSVVSVAIAARRVGGCGLMGVTCQRSRVLAASLAEDAEDCLSLCRRRRHCAAYTFYPPETEGESGVCLSLRGCHRRSLDDCDGCVSGDADCSLNSECSFQGTKKQPYNVVILAEVGNVSSVIAQRKGQPARKKELILLFWRLSRCAARTNEMNKMRFPKGGKKGRRRDQHVRKGKTVAFPLFLQALAKIPSWATKCRPTSTTAGGCATHTRLAGGSPSPPTAACVCWSRRASPGTARRCPPSAIAVAATPESPSSPEKSPRGTRSSGQPPKRKKEQNNMYTLKSELNFFFILIVVDRIKYLSHKTYLSFHALKLAFLKLTLK
jgi:hypothetical protein